MASYHAEGVLLPFRLHQGFLDTDRTIVLSGLYTFTFSAAEVNVFAIIV